MNGLNATVMDAQVQSANATVMDAQVQSAGADVLLKQSTVLVVGVDSEAQTSRTMDEGALKRQQLDATKESSVDSYAENHTPKHNVEEGGASRVVASKRLPAAPLRLKSSQLQARGLTLLEPGAACTTNASQTKERGAASTINARQTKRGTSMDRAEDKRASVPPQLLTSTQLRAPCKIFSCVVDVGGRVGSTRERVEINVPSDIIERRDDVENDSVERRESVEPRVTPTEQQQQLPQTRADRKRKIEEQGSGGGSRKVPSANPRKRSPSPRTKEPFDSTAIRQHAPPRLDSGDKYEGALLDEKKSGRGVYNWPSGNKYEGAWRDDKRSGHGTFTWADGDKYEGAWHENDMHGQGTFTSNTGWSFTGALVRKRPAEGVITEADGRRFTVTYAADCNFVFFQPAPATKVRACCHAIDTPLSSQHSFRPRRLGVGDAGGGCGGGGGGSDGVDRGKAVRCGKGEEKEDGKAGECSEQQTEKELKEVSEILQKVKAVLDKGTLSLGQTSTDPAVIIARLQHKLAAAATLLQRMGRSGDCGAKLQRSFENLSIDVLRHKVLDMADCLPAQACTWNKQSWERWRRQVLRGFDAKTLAGALNSMFEQLVAPALVFSQRTTAHETGEEEGGGGGGG